MNPQQQNAMGRAILLSSGIKMSQLVQRALSLPLAQSTRVDLLRVGITTGVMCDFSVSQNITVGSATASSAGPWPSINQLKYTDFSGIDRVNTDGLGLYLLQSFKHNELADNAIPGEISAIGVINTNILAQPTGVANPATMLFSLWVPMAYDASNDLRGAVPSMTNIGQHYLTITPTSSLVAAASPNNDPTTSPYTAGTIALNSNGFTVDVTQFYIQPQSIAAQQLPQIDLVTIYEINGRNITTSGFQSNSQNLINYPNDRSVMAAYHVFVDGGLLTTNETNMSLVELLVNSNTVVRQMTARRFRAMMRSLLDGDVPPSIYYWAHRAQPILTNLYATVQSRYTFGTLNGSPTGPTKIIAQYESFYPSGQPLSGITPNAG